MTGGGAASPQPQSNHCPNGRRTDGPAKENLDGTGGGGGCECCRFSAAPRRRSMAKVATAAATGYVATVRWTPNKESNSAPSRARMSRRFSPFIISPVSIKSLPVDPDCSLARQPPSPHRVALRVAPIAARPAVFIKRSPAIWGFRLADPSETSQTQSATV